MPPGMAGLERNADLVLMIRYAPLFVNVNPGAMQWRTDLIGYNTSPATVRRHIGRSRCSAASWRPRATHDGI